MEMLKMNKYKFIVGVIALLIVVAGLFFMHKKSVAEKNGDYFYINLDKQHPEVSEEKKFSIANNQVTSSRGIQDFNENMKYKDGVITIDGENYARRNSSAYKSAKKKVETFNKDLIKQKEELAKFEKNLETQIDTATKNVFDDFLNEIEGTYTGKRVFEYAKTTYNISTTIEDNSLKYSVEEIDNFLDENKKINTTVDGTLSTELDDETNDEGIVVTYGEQIGDDNETADYDIRLNIEDKLEVGDVYDTIDTMNQKLDDKELAYTSESKKEITNILERLKKIDSWDSYKELSGVNKVVVVFNGTGSKKSDSDISEIEDKNQNMTLSLIDKDKLELGYTFNSIGGITTDTTNELTRQK